MTAVHLPYTRHCFVCGAENPAGLRLRFRFEDGAIRSDYTPRAEHAGYTGIVHGGVVAATLDEIMFWAAAFATRKFHLSVAMNIRWARKVAVGEPYRLAARLVKTERVFVHAAGELLNGAGDVCASATGKFYPLRRDQVPLDAAEFCFDPAVLAPADVFAAE
jgi:acyl-coenzyme A thioesterase PaaI-like protein